MLVPVKGGVTDLQKRNRTIHDQTAALELVELPNVFIYNVGPRDWKGVGGGREWTVKACPEGRRYSEPTIVPMLVLSERDLADGGNNLDTVMDSAESGTRKVGGEVKTIMGVVDDIIGRRSTSPGLDILTTNGEWFGVFSSKNLNAAGEPEPTEEELVDAEDKLRQMADLIYAEGSEKIATAEQVRPIDRPRYNWAAMYLGKAPLWGNLDHKLDQCPECGEDIRAGAKVCKHCHLPIDEASVAARAKERQDAAEKVLGEDFQKEEAPQASAPARRPAKKGGRR